MSTRTSFRPRPLDTTRQLTIVRDVAELDSTDGLDPAAPGVTAPPADAGQVSARSERGCQDAGYQLARSTG